MKQILAIAALICLFAASATSQVRLGFNVNPTLSWMDTDDKFINGNGTNLGLKLQVRGELFFGDGEKFAVFGGAGFGFNQGGELRHDRGGNFWPKSQEEGDLSNTDLMPVANETDLRYSIRYLEVPVGLKFLTDQIGDSGMRFYFEAPLTLAVKTSARGDISGSGVDIEDENIKRDVNPFNASWGVGLGMEYELPGSDGDFLMLGLTYNQGFLDVTSDKNTQKYIDGTSTLGEEREDSAGTIRGLTLTIGILFSS
jgi:hypothetical protein